MKHVENETPQHFGESGVLLLEDKKTFLTLSTSVLHIGEVGGMLLLLLLLCYCYCYSILLLIIITVVVVLLL